jgi:predicted alpha/beta hydrolase
MILSVFLSILFGLIVFYLLFTLLLSFIVQRIPRSPIIDEPDWGRVIDARIPAVDGGSLEVWRVEPEGASRGIVVFAHGWGRNRDRMVHRARLFADLGFTTVMHSARDHGGSSKLRLVNAVKFAEDIEAVLKWVSEPVSYALCPTHPFGPLTHRFFACASMFLLMAIFISG